MMADLMIAEIRSAVSERAELAAMSKPSLPISVLMSLYNAERFLKDAIESILAQSYEEFECIAVDAGSTDDTPYILSTYHDDRLRVIRTARIPLPDSLNVGLSLARGEWIARMDGDDIAHPTRLEKQLAYVRTMPNVVLVGSHATLINADGKHLWQVRYPGSHDALLHAIAHNGSPFPHSSAMFRRDAAIAVGGYNPRMLSCEDLDLWLRLSEQGRITCAPESLLFLRKHRESKTAVEPEHLMWSLAAQVLHRCCNVGLSGFSASCNDDQWTWFLGSVRRAMQTTGYSLALVQRNALSQAAIEAGRRDWIWFALSTLANPQRILGVLTGPLRHLAFWRCVQLVIEGPK